MKFDDLDRMMRVYETSLDQFVIPGVFIVARIDGRSFTRLTKEVLQLEKPYDIQFRDAMCSTVERLMNSGFRVIYGYTESDEISLLFHPEENLFDRKVRKYNSILAGEASAAFTYNMGVVAAFDCRLCILPNEDKVIDYFRWRAEDAHRNSFNAWCYWKLRESGKSQFEATKMISGISVASKNEMLFQLGINYNDLPSWQKRGVGMYYDHIVKDSYNPMKKEKVSVLRKILKRDLELPLGEGYSNLIRQLLIDAKIE